MLVDQVIVSSSLYNNKFNLVRQNLLELRVAKENSDSVDSEQVEVVTTPLKEKVDSENCKRDSCADKINLGHAMEPPQ